MKLRWFFLPLVATLGAVAGAVASADRHRPAAELPARRVEQAESADGRYTITATEFLAPTCVLSDVGVRIDRHDRATHRNERWYRCGSIPDDLAHVRRPAPGFFRRVWGSLWPSVPPPSVEPIESGDSRDLGSPRHTHRFAVGW